MWLVNLKKQEKQKGFTFTELLVALAINTLLFAALITIFVMNINHYNTVVSTNKLNLQLQATLDLMVNDIRRAGYWANASSDLNSGANNNPFMASGTDLSVNGANNCILFTYDYNNNGSLPSINSGSNDERYGYRLNGTTVQSRPNTAAFSCTAGANTWENLTDPNVISVTALTFTQTNKTVTTGPGTRSMVFRTIDISLTGQLASNSTVTRTLTSHVKVRNDKFSP